MSLHAAIAQAIAAAAQPEPSVFAGLRRRHPALLPQVTLLALTRAIEDECCARAERPALFAAFQRQRFFGQSRRRWDELARTARVMIAFADFGGPAAAAGRRRDRPRRSRSPCPRTRPPAANGPWSATAGTTRPA
jgi:hypothetical protein